jgi:hypothetical protein
MHGYQVGLEEGEDRGWRKGDKEWGWGRNRNGRRRRR